MGSPVELTRSAKNALVRPSYIVVAGAVLLVVVMAMSTTYVDADQADRGPEEFDVEAFGTENFPSVADAVAESAVEMPELLAAIEENEDAAGEEFGNRGDVASPYTFSVTGTGVAGEPDEGLLPIEIEGVPDGIDVQIQIGPVLRGTTLRDAVDFINFDDFVNQLEYSDAARALNDQVVAQALAGLEADQLAGAQVRFVGAFTLLTPSVITITPVQLEVVS